MQRTQCGVKNTNIRPPRRRQNFRHHTVEVLHDILITQQDLSKKRLNENENLLQKHDSSGYAFTLCLWIALHNTDHDLIVRNKDDGVTF